MIVCSADDDPLPFLLIASLVLYIISVHVYVIHEMTFSALSSLSTVNTKHFEKERQKKNNHNASEWIDMCMHVVVHVHVLLVVGIN